MILKCNRSVMSIWGKIIGGATGFAFGGPLGALLGGVAGHAIDKIKTKQKLPEEIALKQIGFTIGVIVLSAKMAKADGKVTQDEIKAFKEKINVPENEIKNVAKLWDQAKKTTDGFEVYAQQISHLLEKNSSVLEEFLNYWFMYHITAAAATIHIIIISFELINLRITTII